MIDESLFNSLLAHTFAFETMSTPLDTVKPQSRAMHWCFTTNNYTEEHVENLRILGNSDDCKYLVFGIELSESGTPHLQGYIAFGSRLRFSEVQQKIPDSHLSVTRQIQKSIIYCKKDGKFEEFGDEPTGAGHRSDLQSFKETVQSGILSLKRLRELHSDTFAKYPRFCADYVRDNMPVPEVPSYPLRPWQERLNQDLLKEPETRKIIFVVDFNGNQGKSWFSQYYCSLHENAQLILPTKKADMAYILQNELRVLFIDAPRSKQGEYIQYDFLEEVKNGFVMSNKYESVIKRYNKVHVVVMMNEMPDASKLSEDRYDIRRI